MVFFMRLSELTTYKDIIIQCHDNPDADALASGFALYSYFQEKGIPCRFVYSGKNQITKSNLVLMIKELDIPISYVSEIGEVDLLINVDCQCGAGNTTLLTGASHVAVIDHHQTLVDSFELSTIKSNYGSCSTIVWQMLLEEDFPVNSHPNIATALYYGLYTDTSQLSEIYHPADKDMRDSLEYNQSTIFRLIHSNISLNELQIAGYALTDFQYSDTYRFSVIMTNPCDPNILGVISDFALQVDTIDTCVVYNRLEKDYKLSIRSCVKEIRANELAWFLTDGIGSGGGHINKSGGFIFEKDFLRLHPDGDMNSYLYHKMEEYYNSYDLIYAKEYDADLTTLKPYIKKNIPIGVVIASELLAEHTPILVRTLEGDLEITVTDSLYIMIGIQGEVYPIEKDKFEKSYQFIDGAPSIHTDYLPTIKNTINGHTYLLSKHIHTCFELGKTHIWAKELQRTCKVFTSWDESKYMLGKPGDYLAVRSDDLHDVYVIERNIFYKTYEEGR